MQRYQVLTNEELMQIHENSLRILENVGVVFALEQARDILQKHGAKVEGTLVKFPRTMVEEKLRIVPSSFTLHARDPKKNKTIDTEHTAFVGPYGSPFITDLDRGRRDAKMDDFIAIAKLCHMLEHIDIQSHIYCEAGDIPVDPRAMEMVYAAMKYNTKPVMGGVLGYEDAKRCIELAAIPFGGLDAIREKPIMAAIPCTLTPLSYDEKMLGAIIAYAECGQPQLINSLTMAGATAPCTLAGAISVQNAEVLAGIILAQCVNPGTPIVYSASGSSADMRTGNVAIGAAEDALFSLINGQLTKFYNIPCRISGALSDGKCTDAQAGYESMMTLLMAQMAGGNYILHSAGILESYNCVSLEKLIIDHEIIGMVKRIGQGVAVDEETLAYDDIVEVGPQGEFLSSDNTAMFFRREFYLPKLSDRRPFDHWAEDKSTAEQRANAKWKQMLEEYEEPTMGADIERDMRRYIESHS